MLSYPLSAFAHVVQQRALALEPPSKHHNTTGPIIDAMTVVHCTLDLSLDAQSVWRLWSEVDRWASFVEGFGSVTRLDGDWPQVDAAVTWDSTPYGRGRVVERVRQCAPESELVVEVDEDRLTAIKRLTLGSIQDGVRVGAELDYRLRGSRWLNPAVDWLFVRRALRDALARELQAMAAELHASG